VSQDFDRHVHTVQRYTSLTDSLYASLLDRSLTYHPICCFGDPDKARVVTVGVNPSKGEFNAGNGWPDSITHTDLAQRCRDYFAGGRTHRWFAPWTEALGHLGASYTTRSAVHVDLSPRATRITSELKEAWEQELFLQMIGSDLWIFFGTLQLCQNAKLLLMAGSVTGRYYINEFLQRFALSYGYSLDGAFSRSASRGKGKVAFHTLSAGGRKIDVFFCSTSPSDRNKTVLPQRVREHSVRLKGLISAL
jgi:hypothetical protein